MFYIERTENEVVKYNVKLYNERLNDIRDRLIKDYSSIISIYNYFCFSNIDKLETDYIKDFTNNTLKVNFNYYIFPKLVVLIDMLLNNNVNVLNDIINYKQDVIKLSDIDNDNVLNIISKNISEKLNVDFNSSDLKYYLNNVRINNEDHTFLIQEILSCISFERVDSIKNSDFYRMMDFLNLNSKDNFNCKIKSVRKKVKNNS